MNHSGPNNPCPCCARTKGDYCRWDSERILCYQGKTCGPPADLKVGQTIDIEGETWALVKTQCGFAGNSCLFVHHDPSTGPVQPQSPEALRRQTVALMLQRDQFETDADLAATALRHVEELPEFNTLPPAQIREALDLCSGAQILFTDLLVRCRRLRRTSPDIGGVASQLQDGLRAIRYQAKDLHQFWHRQLLDPGAGRGKQLAEQLQQEVL